MRKLAKDTLEIVMQVLDTGRTKQEEKKFDKKLTAQLTKCIKHEECDDIYEEIYAGMAKRQENKIRKIMVEKYGLYCYF